MKYRALPTYLLLAILTATPAFGQGGPPHLPFACHPGELWSTSPTYGTLTAGAFAHIPAGHVVVLDTATVPLGGLWVEGTLVFDHTVGPGVVKLNTAYAVVTGSLQIGCHSGNILIRFTKDAEINLVAPEAYGGPASFPLSAGVNWHPDIANEFQSYPEIKEAAFDRGLIITGEGQLLIYGEDKGESWTTLSSTAGVGATSLNLDAALSGAWSAQDSLVLASSDFEYADPARLGAYMSAGYIQDEPLSLQSFSSSNVAVVQPPLAFKHYAATETINFPGGVQDSITMKAEVANLTRSVVIQGESSAYSASVRAVFQGGGGTGEHLGHVALMHSVAGTPFCKVDWTEFRNLGVEAKFGRYPFHFHGLHDAESPTLGQPYIKHCSIHDSVNRFVVVHDTQNVIVEGNVGYNTRSTGFFLEDTIERDQFGAPDPVQIWDTYGVTLRDNLGLMVAAQSKSVDLPTEYSEDIDNRNVSVFWVSHPNQKIEGNHAAGAAGHGFYLAPGKNISWTHLDLAPV